MNFVVDYFYKGGWVMWPILIQALLSLSVFIERSIYLWFTRIPKKKLLDFLEKLKDNSNYDQLEYLHRYQYNECIQLINLFLENFKKKNNQENTLKNKGEELIKKLNQRIFLLPLNGQIAPLFGLLGTVLGMIETFQTIANLQTQPSPSIIASGIWVAMLTTAFGLIVSIPSYIFYVILEKKIEERIDLMNLTLQNLEEFQLQNEISISKESSIQY